MLTALTREVSPSINSCELTHVDRQAIDVALAKSQHLRYQGALAQLGCVVISLPPEDDLPDAVFVEDTAIVFDEIAVIMRPGADSRKPERASIEARLEPYREIARITAPATMDGGDVLCYGKQVFVGLSERSNEIGVEQLSKILAPHQYVTLGVKVTGCLHLKSAVSQVSDNTLLINSDWIDGGIFEGMNLIEVDPTEPMAANALFFGNAIIYPTQFPKTQQRLEEAGIRVVSVDISELSKAEGAVTCCSLIYDDDPQQRSAS